MSHMKAGWVNDPEVGLTTLKISTRMFICKDTPTRQKNTPITHKDTPTICKDTLKNV